MSSCIRIVAAVALVVSTVVEANLLGSHEGFPVELVKAGAPSYTYISVKDPNALNLDGSIYGIAVCLSSLGSKANWTFSTDGGGW